jgi:hypothetical protein
MLGAACLDICERAGMFENWIDECTKALFISIICSTFRCLVDPFMFNSEEFRWSDE